MPKPKPGYSQVNLLIPDEVLAAWRASAERAGQTLHEWIARTCARRSGIEYSPPRRGRPKTTPADSKS